MIGSCITAGAIFFLKNKCLQKPKIAYNNLHNQTTLKQRTIYMNSNKAEKKYELTDDTYTRNGHTRYRIRALKDFGKIKAGDLGGYVESEDNLSHEGTCWVHNDACILENAKVYGDAQVYGEARVYGNAQVFENARICEYAEVFERAKVYGKAIVSSEAWIGGNAKVYGDAQIWGNAGVYDKASVFGNAVIYDKARIFGKSKVYGNAEVYNNTRVYNKTIFF